MNTYAIQVYLPLHYEILYNTYFYLPLYYELLPLHYEL